MLYIFDSTEKLITTLPEDSFFNAIHREVLNGENTFQFTIPAGNEYVVEGNLVAFRDLDSYWQIFEIKRIVDVHGDGLTRTAYCEHIFYELLDDIVTDKRPSADATAALAGMLENTRWQVGIVDDLGAASTSAYYISALEAVQKVADAWKGELHWRCVVAGGVITRYVDLLAQRGTDTGKQFVYSKDILSIEREVDSSGVVTALYGRGKGIELDSGSYGRRLTFADVVAPDKPAGQEWIGDSEALAQWGRPGGRHRFDVFIDEEETDPAKLLQKTRDELDRRKVPRATYRLDVVSLEELTGYEHEKVRLGDMVRVIDREFNPELVVSARVVEIERDLLDPANTKVVLGSFAPTIVEATINTARRVDEMANRPYNTKWLDGKINVLQNAIENTQSYVFQTGEDGILILDAPTYEQATKAMKLGGGIFAIANQKDGQGGWNWRTFGDGSGFTADLITAGMIDAGLVQIGPQTTFAPGYDPSQIEGASAVGMGVDADCLGLWHFDGSLNSHKGVAADSDALFGGGCFGQALSIATGKHLKVPTTDMLASAGVINFRAKNLSASANGSMLIDLPDNAGNQGMLCGIANDGKIFIEDAKLQFQSVETSQADFNTGTLSDVQATSAGNLELVRDGQDFTYSETSQADFQSGILTDVEATSAGDLELATTMGKALSFDGVDDYVDCGNNVSLKRYATDFTIEAKIKLQSFPATYVGAIVSNRASGAGSLFFIRGELDATGKRKLSFDTDQSAGTRIIYGNTLLELNKEYHVVVTYRYIGSNTNEAKLYINGVLDATDNTMSDILDPGTTATFIGMEPGAVPTDYHFDGTIDDVRIWNVARTQQQIQDNMNKELTGNETGLVGYWKFDEGTGNTAYDSTANANNGTVYGATWADGLVSSYKPSGTREKIVDLSGANPAGGTKIEWAKTTPANTAVKVETALSIDGGTTYGAYQEATSGSSIPGITSSTNLSNARLKIRETLSTTDTSATPQLHSLNFDIYASYKSSGYRYKVYDISAVGSVGSSKITWTENKPASTTLTVKAAVSTDGGSSYSSFQPCTNGGSIPGLTQGMDISNARLKVQEDLATSDGTKTPQLQSLTIEVGSDVQRAYGPNKSTLTGWDSISLAWKPERLSLVVNDEEACFIENPGLPASLGTHVFIGTDRNGNNAINTLVDELRVDKVYREVNIRTGWHKMGVPFYTSEDMKQWPGYVRAETDGLKVYDSSDALRVLVGSWLKDAVRKYGIKIIDGEIYSSIIRSGAEDATTYIQFNPPNSLEVYYGGYLQMLIEAVSGGRITFYNNGTMIGRLSGALSGGDLGLIGIDTGNIYIGDNLYVNGNISKAGTYSALEPTLNYGDRLLYAAECPELKYYDSGIINLQNGDATVYLDPIFLECIEPDTELTPWQIWVQCYGENDVYVAEVGTDYFVIKERNGGTSNNKVVWRFEAIRKNYAGIRLMEVTN